MQDHFVAVPSARLVGEIPSLVFVHGPLWFMHIGEEIAFFLFWGRRDTWMCGFGGAHAQALIAHVALLGLL